MKNKFRVIFSVFFIIAGVNHFIMPWFYEPLIPEIFHFIQEINYLSGFLEILFGTGLFFEKTRHVSAVGIMLLLICFIPSHVYFIQMDSCIGDGLCVHPSIAWVRLLVIHPLLIYGAWKCRKN